MLTALIDVLYFYLELLIPPAETQRRCNKNKKFHEQSLLTSKARSVRAFFHCGLNQMP
jgi:hypothetical protein